MEKILQSYLRRLTNLSGNNRSLLLLRLISDQFLDLHDLDFASNQPSFKIIEDLIARKTHIHLCDEFDSRDHSVNKNSQKLRKINRIEDFIFQERGARDLYVGWPFIKGKYSDGTPVRCPLIFFPVSLTRKSGSWYLEQRKDVNITFNKTFLLGYAYYNQVSLDEELIEQVLTDLSTDSTVYRTELYEILKNSKLELNFNQANFMDVLQPFINYKRADFEETEREGELKLHPEAVLGIFPQAGSYLVPDYVKLLENPEGLDIEQFFTSKESESDGQTREIRFSDKVKEETTFTPFELDASQEQALKLVKNGNSLTIQGPPGTGKSQLICNLISDFIARGKNVLLVCQKKAALDVVYQRLQKKQLHDFIGLVHDFKNDRKDIFEQIARQIDSLDDYRQKNNGLDAIQLERTFIHSSRKIDQITEELDEFKKALFDDTECGKSVKELYLTSDPEQPSIPLNQQYRSLDYQSSPEFINRLSRYLDYYFKFQKQPNFWLTGPSFASFSTQDFLKIKNLIHDIPAFEESLKSKSKDFSVLPLDFESSLHFLTHLEDLKQLRTNLDNEQVFNYYKHMMEFLPDENSTWLTNHERTLMNCFKSEGIETSLPTSELGRFQESLERAIKARKSAISWLKWKMFSADKIFITRVLVANELKSTKEGFETLLRRMDNRLNFEHIVSIFEQKKWLTDFPNTFRKIEIQNWFFYQKLGLKCADQTREIRTIDQFMPVKNRDRASFIQSLDQLFDFLEEIPKQLQLWAEYISQKQIRAILLGIENPEKLDRDLSQEFDSIVEFHRLKEEFSRDEELIVSTLLEHDHSEKKSVLTLFENSLALAWINHIETKHPVLRAVSSHKIDHLSQDLQLAIGDKMAASREILLLKSRERTYANLEYNRLNNLVTYRDLYHQVTKKKKIWPIRKVIAQYHEEIFSLLPCWLASPESASAIFPMAETFDLVIFDEASQCFAERGIPAMYRGKQVVVVGDDQQLQPNDLYRVRWEEESDDIPELEVDSLLGLAKKYLPEVSLRGHYRSKAIELIEFSNIHFYNGKLKILPDFRRIRKKEPAIHYLKKSGIWQQNANEEEADEVIRVIERLLEKSPEKSIGVVTFNVNQQNLILDKLEEKQTENNWKLPEDLFVKNIENVQGDERDIIIFTTAYAPDEKGNLQLRFGSLNQTGGENRLNVAITRAREEVYMITSLLPHQLNTELSVNRGPKLLKAYLEYAKLVSDGLWKPASMESKTYTSNWYLRQKLQLDTENASIEKNLPFADITVKSNENPAGLVLTDDELFYDTLSPKEAHSYRQQHFIQMNWPYIQIYSREFWISREQTQRKLEQFAFRVSD